MAAAPRARAFGVHVWDLTLIDWVELNGCFAIEGHWLWDEQPEAVAVVP